MLESIQRVKTRVFFTDRYVFTAAQRYGGIQLDTARIQISNQNTLLPLVQTVLKGIPRYK
jgi:hypothetical protein